MPHNKALTFLLRRLALKSRYSDLFFLWYVPTPDVEQSSVEREGTLLPLREGR